MGAVVDLKPPKRRLDEARAELIVIATGLVAHPERQLDPACDEVLAAACRRFALLQERCG